VGAAGVVFGKAVDRPGVAEDAGRFEALDGEGGGVATVPGELGLTADVQVDLGLVAEPGAQALGGGQCRPDPLRRVGQLNGALDSSGNAMPVSLSSNQLVAIQVIATN
jgi:hypothetical protein